MFKYISTTALAQEAIRADYLSFINALHLDIIDAQIVISQGQEKGTWPKYLNRAAAEAFDFAAELTAELMTLDVRSTPNWEQQLLAMTLSMWQLWSSLKHEVNVNIALYSLQLKDRCSSLYETCRIIKFAAACRARASLGATTTGAGIDCCLLATQLATVQVAQEE